MRTIRTKKVSTELLFKMQDFLCKGFAYCSRKCGRWGSPSCFACMFRDVRSIHKQLEAEAGGE